MILQHIIDIKNDIRLAVKTNAFRLSLIFTLIASIITGISMYLIYQTSRLEISTQIDARLSSEVARLQRFYESENTTIGFGAPTVGVVQRIPSETAMAFCLKPDPKDAGLGGIDQNSIFEIQVSDLCSLTGNPDEISDIDQPVSASLTRLFRVKVASLRNHYLLVVGYDTYSEQIILRKMLNTVSFITAILILASFLGSFFLSKKIAKSVKIISRTARRITDGDFSERIPVSNQDSVELQSLSNNLNHMLDRLESLITSQRQVTNNIAHDLRSPLNRLRSRMEVALLDKDRKQAELREVLITSIEDVEALLKTFNALLNVAQVESRARDDFSTVDVSKLASGLTEMYEVLNEEGKNVFSSKIEEGLSVIGNFQLIAQATTNLIDNAVKYTAENEHIHLAVYQHKSQIIIAVSDRGKGIPEHERARVLKRFVRLDSARSTPGNGLGLSLVSAVMDLHGGSVHIEDNHPGAVFQLVFPDIETFKKM